MTTAQVPGRANTADAIRPKIPSPVLSKRLPPRLMDSQSLPPSRSLLNQVMPQPSTNIHQNII